MRARRATLLNLGKYKIAIPVVAVLVTAGPVIWFTSWLQKQGETEVSVLANWSVGITDANIDQAVSTLTSLAERGLDSCKSPGWDALRATVLATGIIKEISLVAPNGQTLCADTGSTFVDRETVVTAATATPDVVLDVVQFSDQSERMLRIRRALGRGKPSLAALIPAAPLLPHLMQGRQPLEGFAQLSMTDGTLIARSGKPGAPDSGLLVSEARSDRYGTVAKVATTRGSIVADYDDLRRIGVVVSAMFALAILFAALLLPRRLRNDPYYEIEQALAADQFVPFYQPIIDMKSGKLLGAEVLARWRKPDGSLVPPIKFIPVVESTPLILDMTRALMRKAIHDVGALLAQRPHIYLTFNTAPRHYTDSVILNDVGEIFDGSQIHFSQLVLELTERCALDNLSATRRVIASLQGLGCRVAMDDVGTGQNGLSYILKLGVDVIKIDKLFVESIGTDQNSQVIVETLVDLARNLRMQIVAEGVEEIEQVNYLREHGIVAAQGYLFAPPLPASAFVKLMQTMEPAAPSAEATAAAVQKAVAPTNRAAA